MELETVTEGGTRLQVPAGRSEHKAGPTTAGSGFYNPVMALTRDLSVLACRADHPADEPRFLDGLAASGARGLRVAHEAPGWAVTLNDRDAGAAKLIAENAKALGLDVRATNHDLIVLLRRGAWHVVDVDPYGSPVPFLQQAIRSVRHGGRLCVSATDTSALHGVRSKVTRRRYLAEGPPKKAPGWKAAAARLLAGYVVRTAAQQDKAATPLYAFEHHHAFRACFRIENGARRADRALGQVGTVVLCQACQTWGEESCRCEKGTRSGPYWLGPLTRPSFAASLREAAGQEDVKLAAGQRVDRLLRLMEGEARLGPFYLDVPEASSAMGVHPPARRDLIQALQEAGIPAAPTHFSPEAVAYDGDPAEALEVFAQTAAP